MKNKLLKIVSVNLIGFILFTNISFAAPRFSDVTEEQWFYDDVTELVDRGIINGYDDGTFRPYENITVAEFLKLVIVSTTGKTFEPVQGRHWAQGYFDYAVMNKIIYAKDFSELDFNKTLRREDMAGIIIGANYKILNNPMEDVEGIKDGIKDYDDIKLIRRDDVLQLYKIGLIKGNGVGNFYPKGFTTRADVSTVIMRLIRAKK